jgi:hypothetical protein
LVGFAIHVKMVRMTVLSGPHPYGASESKFSTVIKGGQPCSWPTDIPFDSDVVDGLSIALFWRFPLLLLYKNACILYIILMTRETIDFMTYMI